eukprot:scaffold1355_cov336-Prasinococcus_capsulatus_cf.AAC.4
MSPAGASLTWCNTQRAQATAPQRRRRRTERHATAVLNSARWSAGRTGGYLACSPASLHSQRCGAASEHENARGLGASATATRGGAAPALWRPRCAAARRRRSLRCRTLRCPPGRRLRRLRKYQRDGLLAQRVADQAARLMAPRTRRRLSAGPPRRRRSLPLAGLVRLGPHRPALPPQVEVLDEPRPSGRDAALPRAGAAPAPCSCRARARCGRPARSSCAFAPPPRRTPRDRGPSLLHRRRSTTAPPPPSAPPPRQRWARGARGSATSDTRRPKAAAAVAAAACRGSAAAAAPGRPPPAPPPALAAAAAAAAARAPAAGPTPSGGPPRCRGAAT